MNTTQLSSETTTTISTFVYKRQACLVGFCLQNLFFSLLIFLVLFFFCYFSRLLLLSIRFSKNPKKIILCQKLSAQCVNVNPNLSVFFIWKFKNKF